MRVRFWIQITYHCLKQLLWVASLLGNLFKFVCYCYYHVSVAFSFYSRSVWPFYAIFAYVVVLLSLQANAAWYTWGYFCKYSSSPQSNPATSLGSCVNTGLLYFQFVRFLCDYDSNCLILVCLACYNRTQKVR